MAVDDPVEYQRAYYRQSAEDYNTWRHRGQEQNGHAVALSWLGTEITRLGITSVLDVGSGTGRVLLGLGQTCPEVKTIGIEPSAEMREQGHRAGLSESQLIEGDGQHLEFEDGSFDLVCEFGALHHIPDPRAAVNEMLRVARKAVFLFDVNDFGGGRPVVRFAKQTLNGLRLWHLADLVKTRGKGYRISEGDGLSYSYSLFNDFRTIKEGCRSVHLMTTSSTGRNPYRSATHIALLGIK
jgi:ubiquinone/menaquinone biosynthesis C-methylase UbiE